MTSFLGSVSPINPTSINPISNPFRTDPADAMSGTKLGPTFRQQIVDGDDTRTSFQDVLGKTVGHINATLSEPDALMKQAMTTGGVDVHDVMVANAKAELVINVTTQVATKVIQAYDRILQIQI